MAASGQIRVGRRIYSKTSYSEASFPGFTPIIVMTKSTEYGSLSPYELKDKYKRILENIWQFSKFYKQVPISKQKYSKYDTTVTWHHPAEIHANSDGTPNDLYTKWREKGMKNIYPVRYPVGFNYRHKCVCSYHVTDEGEVIGPLNYIQSRKIIYWPIYNQLVREKAQFLELKERLARGENLLIIEVDGPHQESLTYYKDKYGVNDDFIVNETILATKENLGVMLNDDKHPFGHGYCLAAALQDFEFS